MLTLLSSLRKRVLEAIKCNAEAARRLLDTAPAARPIQNAVLRARAPSNGRPPRLHVQEGG